MLSNRWPTLVTKILLSKTLYESNWDNATNRRTSVVHILSSRSTFVCFKLKKNFLSIDPEWSVSNLNSKSEEQLTPSMARIIQKTIGKDVLETVRWKEYVVIYVQSLVLNFFIVCKSVLLSLKNYFDYRLGPARQHIAHKFPALSLIKSGEAKVTKKQQSVACPLQLMDSQLGSHKFIKLKVRISSWKTRVLWWKLNFGLWRKPVQTASEPIIGLFIVNNFYYSWCYF